MVDLAIETIQAHLDREAFNRRQLAVKPRELCPLQKHELASDLAILLR